MSKPHSKACKCFYCEQQRKPPEQPPEVPCAQCGKPVEKERHVYAIPTCYACLPPPATLPEVPAPGDSADLEAIRRCLEAYGPHSLREAARTLLRMVDELTETVHRLSSGWDTERDELTANRDEAVRGCKDWEKAYRKMEDEMRAKLARYEEPTGCDSSVCRDVVAERDELQAKLAKAETLAEQSHELFEAEEKAAKHWLKRAEAAEARVKELEAESARVDDYLAGRISRAEWQRLGKMGQ